MPAHLQAFEEMPANAIYAKVKSDFYMLNQYFSNSVCRAKGRRTSEC